MEGSEVKQETPAVKQPTAAQWRNWNPLATPKRALLSILVVVVLSAGVIAGILKLQTPTGHVKWSHTIGPVWHSTPTMSNGVLYIGTADNRVWALDAASGHIIWTVPLGTSDESSGITPAPVVSNGVVYANSQDGFIYALDANTGNTLWSYKGYSMMAPAVANGSVYVGTEEGVLLALDAVSGRLLWSQESKEQYDFLSTSPVVAQGMVYAAGGDGGITALDAASGQKKWERSTLPIGHTPTVANGVLFLPTVEGELDALDTSSGQVKWQAVHGEGFTSSPVVVGDTVYIYSYAGVFAMDRTSGKDRWFRKMNGTLAALIVANNAVYMVAGDRNWKPNGLSLGPDNQELDVLDASTGSDLWYYPLSGLSFSTPAVSEGVAYIGAGDGKMYALLPPG